MEMTTPTGASLPGTSTYHQWYGIDISVTLSSMSRLMHVHNRLLPLFNLHQCTCTSSTFPSSYLNNNITSAYKREHKQA